MESPTHPVVEEGPEQWNERYGGSRMLIATPRLVEAEIRSIPAGRLSTVERLREKLADDWFADYTCPLTTGIFVRITAEYAAELHAEGAADIPPYWRMLQSDGTLNPKFPGGMASQAAHLQQEGFTILPKGKNKLVVRDYQKFLV